MGGSKPRPTPAGVPVEMTSPGRSVMYCERYATMWLHEKIMFLVLPFCICLPLTVSHSFRFCGSLISSFVARNGPSGAKVSHDFPLTHCPSCSIW